MQGRGRSIGLAWLVLGGSLIGSAPGVATAAAAPEVRSQAYYIVDDADSVLASRHANTPAPIASITKLMTAIVVLEAAQPLDEDITISAEDVRGTTGSSSRLPQGARLSRSELLLLALMSSENRAAHALCRAYPEGLAACVRAMNAKAAELGMKTARFVEPTGLSKLNVASPRDLAKLVHASSEEPLIREYSTAVDYTLYLGAQAIVFRNTNVLVDREGWQVELQKTGYISEAGRCLVMQTVIQGRQVVIVLLNSAGRLTRIADANRIRTWLEALHATIDSA